MLTIHAADEAIWHFIGLFHMAEEQARMRLDYDRIGAIRTDIDPGDVQTSDIATGHSPRFSAHIPDIPYGPPGHARDEVAVSPSDPEMAPLRLPIEAPDRHIGIADSNARGFTATEGDSANFLRPPPPQPPGPSETWELPVPGSVAVTVIQHGRLTDDDSVDAHKFHGGATDPALFDGQVEALTSIAAQIGVNLDTHLPGNDAGFVLMAKAFADSSVAVTFPDSVTFATLQGEAITGLHLNGAEIAERPEFDSLLPAYRLELKDAALADSAITPAKNHGQHAGPKTEKGAGELAQDHTLVHGLNTMVNDAAITSAWMTAPVMAVGGSAYSYHIISQVNVWNDQDVLSDHTGASIAGVMAPTKALNLAQVASVANPVPDYGQGDDAPQFWLTATLEGSLISMNWIDQYALISDNDITTISLQAQQSFYLMGENQTVNALSLKQIGAQFDIIIADGHLINLNAILQTNVLLDSDRIITDGPAGAISAGDNLLLNDATIMTSGQSHLSRATPDDHAMLQSAAAGEVVLPPSVLNDPRFEGLDLLRVLHIKGDLVSVNVVRQTNVMGDADQIDLRFGDVLDTGGEVRVVSGSNLLVNTASIAEFGVDSTVHVAGQHYSDALLHQAELVSTDAPLMPGQANALASEAVLFLADGMIGDESGEADVHPIGSGASLSPDIMETMLS